MNSLRRCKPLLGTYVEISLEAQAGERELLDLSERAFAELARIHNLMSFHQADSELARMNRGAAHRPFRLSDDMLALLVYAQRLSETTQGVFDVTSGGELVRRGCLPDPALEIDAGADWRDVHIEGEYVRFGKPLLIDLGGIAKGYAVDRAVETIAHAASVCVNAGGDLRMNKWLGTQVDLRVPSMQSPEFILVTMRNAALATSADYFSGSNPVLKPGLGDIPGRPRHSVSVFASTCVQADALTKVAFLAPRYMSSFSGSGVHAMTLDERGAIKWM